MQEILAYSTFFTTVGLVISRPRVGATFRFGPGTAGLLGILVMLAFGILRVADVGVAVATLWRPILGIAAIMVTTTVAERLGVLAWLTSVIEARAHGSVRRLFLLVFVLAALTAAVMNNDAAVLILTPMVIALVRRAFPAQPGLVLPFAFAVFMAAGVAPLVVSNPMNMVMASRMGIGFNTYALYMLPVSLAGWIVTFLALRWLFRRELAVDVRGRSATRRPLEAAQRHVLLLLVGSLAAYPLIAYAGGPVWIVAVAVALVALVLAARHGQRGPAGGRVPVGSVKLVREAVAWDILVFLCAAFLIALGLRNVGLVERLASAYQDAGAATVGAISALGSALLNNHPMSHLNMLAIGDGPDAFRSTLAALVGGDLGPRLFPLGSLAGLLWLESLRRQGLELSVARFVFVGVVATVPALLVSLAIVALY